VRWILALAASDRECGCGQMRDKKGRTQAIGAQRMQRTMSPCAHGIKRQMAPAAASMCITTEEEKSSTCRVVS
jgi:hypothetical protein